MLNAVQPGSEASVFATFMRDIAELYFARHRAGSEFVSYQLASRNHHTFRHPVVRTALRSLAAFHVSLPLSRLPRTSHRRPAVIGNFFTTSSRGPQWMNVIVDRATCMFERPTNLMQPDVYRLLFVRDLSIRIAEPQCSSPSCRPDCFSLTSCLALLLPCLRIHRRSDRRSAAIRSRRLDWAIAADNQEKQLLL
jgi:hypothetical protein